MPQSGLWLLAGVCTIALALLLETKIGASAQLAQDALGVSIANAILRYYWAGALLVFALVAWHMGSGAKTLQAKVIPAVALSLLVADIIHKLSAPLWQRPGRIDDWAGLPSEGVAIVFALCLALLVSRKHPLWMSGAAFAIFGLLGWASLETGAHYAPDLLAGIGAGLVGLAAITRARKRQDALAFGVIPAFRKYELYMMRYVAPAEFIRQELQQKGSLRVLDIGAGYGPLKRFCPGADVEMHGIELDPKGAAACEALGYKIEKCDLETEPLPYQSDSFDVVVINHCLEHLVNPDIALKEADRILRADGLLIVGTPNKKPGLVWIAQLRKQAELRQQGRRKAATHQAFTLKAFLGLLRRTLPAYEVVDVRGFRFLSARQLLPFEDWHWFYKFSTALGQRFPALTSEANVVLRKRTDTPSPSAKPFDFE